MAFLQNFSKILIFKNSPQSKFYFETDGTTGPKVFNQTYPQPNLTDAGYIWPDASQPNFIKDNLLHTMGVEESQALGYEKTPARFGQAYLDGDEIYIDNDAIVANFLLLPSAATVPGQTYVVSSTGVRYTSDGTNWIDKGRHDITLATPLVADDYIFYGPADASDPNDLLIAGKVKNVFTTAITSGSPTTRIELQKSSNVSNQLVDLYYYRKSWNGKNIPVDITNGFYVLIGIEASTDPGATSRRVVYPLLAPETSSTPNQPTNNIIDQTVPNRTAFTDLIRIRRISKNFKSDETRELVNGQLVDEIIPCTITRTNVFDQGSGASYFSSTASFPHWCAYFVNPYGSLLNTLNKSSVYIIEINEMLPAIKSGDIANDFVFYDAATKLKIV